MKKILVIILAAILTLTLSLTSITLSSEHPPTGSNSLPMDDYSGGGRGINDGACNGSACGPSAGVSIGRYYRDRVDRDEDGIDDYKGLPKNKEMYDDLFRLFPTWPCYTGPSTYGPGFVGMTEEEATIEDFEWGDDGDSLATSGGEVDWTVYLIDGSYTAEIDRNKKHAGTRSAKFYGNGDGSLRAYYKLVKPEYIGTYIMKHDRASALVYNGFDDGYEGKCIYIRISDAERLEYGTPSYQDVCEFSSNTWHRLELKNIDWTEGTFDIYLDGEEEEEGAEMWEVRYLGDEQMNYALVDSSGSFWVDDILEDYQDYQNYPYDNFSYIHDDDVTAEDYSDIVAAIDNGWPIVLLTTAMGGFKDDLGVVRVGFEWGGFEWGSDEDSLDTSEDWTVYLIDGSYTAEIDEEIMHSGTRSAKFYGNGDGSLRAYYELVEPEYIGTYIMKQDNASALVYNGNGTECIYIRISDAERLEYRGSSSYQDVCEFSANTWHRLELKNIDWTEGTFDIYLDGEKEEEGAEMWEVLYLGNGEMNYSIIDSSGSFWVDDILDEDYQLDKWPSSNPHAVAIRGYYYNSEATPAIYTVYCTDSTSHYDNVWLDWMNLGTNLHTIIIKDGVDPVIEDFEWGDDGDRLDTSGGEIEWRIGSSTQGDSIAEIDTSQKYLGIRSARIYRDGTNHASAYYSLYHPSYIGTHIRRDGNADTWVYNGDGTKRVTVRISGGEMLQYYDTALRDVCLVSIDTWHLLELEHIDWNAGTFDIYLDGILRKKRAGMQATSLSNGSMWYVSFSGSGEFWVDDILDKEPVIEDFEWGDDGDRLDTSGGEIEWRIGSSTQGDSIAEIDTSQKYSGTRSARIYRDGTINPSAYYSLYHPSYIGAHIRRDGNADTWVYNGDGTNRVTVRISEGEMLQYRDTVWRDVCSVSVDAWHLLELENIDWDANTFDIYLDGILRKEGAGMQATSYSSGNVWYVSFSGSGEFWVDDILN